MFSIQLKLGLKPVAQTIFFKLLIFCDSKTIVSSFASSVLPTQVIFFFLNNVFTSVPITGCPLLLNFFPHPRILIDS
jgi:hypothetical protein